MLLKIASGPRTYYLLWITIMITLGFHEELSVQKNILDNDEKLKRKSLVPTETENKMSLQDTFRPKLKVEKEN